MDFGCTQVSVAGIFKKKANFVLLEIQDHPSQNPNELWEKLQKCQTDSLSRLHGLFPSVRSHPWGYYREDYSAYFTATLLHSLMRLAPWLTNREQTVLEKIRVQASAGVAPFQNKQGLHRYNFWQTNPGRHFPNGWLLGRWDRFRPPDDVDDSVMIYQMQKRSHQEALWLKNHIDDYANGSRKWIRNAPIPYRNLRAYCTFFCKDMPLGFDACVITNVLYFNRLYGFEPNFKEQDSIGYLLLMLKRRDHILAPRQVSPYYPHTSIILYHLAKLMSSFTVPELENRRLQVRQDIEELLSAPLQPVERTMLENAWMWMTGDLPPQQSGGTKKGVFYFFVLPLTLEFEGTLAQWLAHQRWTHIRFHCEALEWAFQIENHVLKRNLLTINEKRL